MPKMTRSQYELIGNAMCSFAVLPGITPEVHAKMVRIMATSLASANREGFRPDRFREICTRSR